MKTIDEWFEFALRNFNYIPIAIFDYEEVRIRFTGRIFTSVRDFENHWNEQIQHGYFKAILEGYGFDSGINGYESVDIKHLKKIFKSFVEKAEIKVIGKPHKDWPISNWSIPVKLFRKDIEITYPKQERKLTLVEVSESSKITTKEVGIEEFQKKLKDSIDNA